MCLFSACAMHGIYRIQTPFPDCVWDLRPAPHTRMPSWLTSSMRKKSLELVLDTRSSTASDVAVLKPSAMTSLRVSRLSSSLNLRLMMASPRSPNLYAMLSAMLSSSFSYMTALATAMQLILSTSCTKRVLVSTLDVHFCRGCRQYLEQLA